MGESLQKSLRAVLLDEVSGPECVSRVTVERRQQRHAHAVPPQLVALSVAAAPGACLFVAAPLLMTRRGHVHAAMLGACVPFTYAPAPRRRDSTPRAPARKKASV